MQLGIDRLINEKSLQAALAGKRLALVGHPASMTSTMQHSLDALAACSRLTLSAAFGPQHGMRGDKQDNMVESVDYTDPQHGIPIFSLYGEVRRPSDSMMDSFDVLLFDVQDIGCRIYTYATTLLYLLEACAKHGKAVWILDRPNPAGRPIEGSILLPGWESFVGAGQLVMRHGLTMGELASWFIGNHQLDVELRIVEMLDYDPTQGPDYGWPQNVLSWVNPSPNAASVNMARCYAGTVMLEGCTLSEGRGTTIALEVVGAPDIDFDNVLVQMQDIAPQWMQACDIRPCYFQPTFHKHEGQLCHGFQLHSDNPRYQHKAFKPYRLFLACFKSILTLYPDYPLWRDFPYEYETERLAIDVINGGPQIREWVEDSEATVEDLEKLLRADEKQWRESIEKHYCYPSDI